MKLPLVKDLEELLISLKSVINDQDRPVDFDKEFDDDIPTIMVTINYDTKTGNWGWQTRYNSYSGGIYSFDTWVVVYLTRKSNCEELASGIQNEILDLVKFGENVTTLE